MFQARDGQERQNGGAPLGCNPVVPGESVIEMPMHLDDIVRNEGQPPDLYIRAQLSLGRIEKDPLDLSAYLEAVWELYLLGENERVAELLEGAPDAVRSSAELGFLHATIAEWQGDIALCLERWADLSRRFPDHAKPYESQGRLLLMSGCRDEAEALLAAMPRKARMMPEATVLGIRLAIARAEWSEARDRLTRLREHVAAVPHAIEAPILGELQRAIADGEAGVHRVASIRQARDAEARLDWQQAAEIWTELRHRHPYDRDVMLGSACNARETGDLGTADAHFERAIERFPSDIEILAGYAQVPARRLDWPASVKRWRVVLETSPRAILFAGLAAMVYAEAGETEEAAALLDRAEAADPARADLVVPQAIVAERAHDWNRAVTYWTRAVRLNPENRHFRDQLGKAVWHRELEPGPHPAAGAGIAEHHQHRADWRHDPIEPGFDTLLQSFENLCDTCEFGLVQRHFGTEPVSLFRFAGVTPEKLIELLNLEFAPIGDIAHTHVEDKFDEYMVYDDRGYFFLHSMVNKADVHAQRYLKQQTARIGFLKRKLIADLQSTRKTLVCRRTGGAITDQTLLELSAGLRRYGDNLLLGVRVADAEHPVGSAHWLTEHVIVGYIGFTFYNEGSHIDYAGWLGMLQTAGQLRAERAARMSGRTVCE